MAAVNYDRWLKDAATWAQEDDWDPDAYFKWVKRLAEAKAQLDDTYLSVDKSLLEAATNMAAVRKAELKKAGGNPQITESTVAKLIVRYIIAYHFFTRASFEEIPEKALVGRVQQHLAMLEIGILDVDIAHMLQCAADKKTLEMAVKEKLAQFAKEFKAAAPTVNACIKSYVTPDAQAMVIKRLRVMAKTQKPPSKATLHQMWSECRDEFARLHPERYNQFQDPAKDGNLADLVKALDTRDKLDMFLARRAEPQLEAQDRDNDEFRALELMVAGDDLDKLLATAKAWEKERCSWDATIGPAVKALRRLGRTSSGKDYNKLAEYAQAHAKPISV